MLSNSGGGVVIGTWPIVNWRWDSQNDIIVVRVQYSSTEQQDLPFQWVSATSLNTMFGLMDKINAGAACSNADCLPPALVCKSSLPGSCGVTTMNRRIGDTANPSRNAIDTLNLLSAPTTMANQARGWSILLPNVLIDRIAAGETPMVQFIINGGATTNYIFADWAYESSIGDAQGTSGLSLRLIPADDGAPPGDKYMYIGYLTPTTGSINWNGAAAVYSVCSAGCLPSVATCTTAGVCEATTVNRAPGDTAQLTPNAFKTLQMLLAPGIWKGNSTGRVFRFLTGILQSPGAVDLRVWLVQDYKGEYIYKDWAFAPNIGNPQSSSGLTLRFDQPPYGNSYLSVAYAANNSAFMVWEGVADTYTLIPPCVAGNCAPPAYNCDSLSGLCWVLTTMRAVSDRGPVSGNAIDTLNLLSKPSSWGSATTGMTFTFPDVLRVGGDIQRWQGAGLDTYTMQKWYHAPNVDGQGTTGISIRVGNFANTATYDITVAFVSSTSVKIGWQGVVATYTGSQNP